MLVVEMGMDDRGQIEAICKVARPDMGIITNVGTSHLEYLGTRENIARAKGELAWSLGQGGVLFQNALGEYTGFIEQDCQLEQRGVKAVHFAGDSQNCDVYATDVELDEFGCPSFMLHAYDESVPCKLSLKGAHNVINACGAAAVALECGMSLQDVACALAGAQPESGRQEILRCACGTVVFNDAYNASPESMRASLAMLQVYNCSGQKIAVLGDMGELGSSSQQGHRETGEAAAKCGVTHLVCVGQQARLIAQGARDAGMDPSCVLEVETPEQAIAALVANLGSNDVVLVKASHFMGLERVVKGIVEAC